MNGYDGIKPTALRAYPFAPAGAARRLFPPKYDQAEDAQHALLSVVRRAPDLFGHRQSRWTLATLMQSCPWLRVHTPSGLWQVLDRLDIRYKRGRSYVHSPDPHYEAKVAHLEAAWATAQAQPQQIVFLYQDECHYYRQPTLASAYSLKGKDQPLAPRGYGGNPRCGLLGGLNALTGQTTYAQHRRIGIDQLVAFYRTLAQVYAPAQQIFIVQDNLPLHFHPNVLVHLQPQQWLWPPAVPDNWPTQPTVQPTAPALPIRLLLLPTYASWLNPIEKLWRWLKQTLLHMHGFGHDVKQLEQHVADFLDQFLDGSTDLLRYTGLLYD